MNKSAVWFVVLMILTCTSLAAEDFQFNTPDHIDALRCVKTTHSFSIFNTGTTSSTYDISVAGSAADWVSAPGSLTLSAGQNAPVLFTLDTPCTARDSQALEFIVTATASGLQDGFSLQVDVATPNDINMTPQVFSDTINPCGKATYSVSLQNPAPFEETYTIGLKNPSAIALQISVPQKQVIIAPKGVADVSIDVTPSDCKQAGETPLTLTVDTKQTKLHAELDFSLTVKQEGMATIGSNVERIVTGYTPSAASIDIRNDGTSKETYALSIIAPSWIALNISTITLDAGQTSPLTLVLKANDSVVPEGDYPINVTAAPQGKNAVYSGAAIVRVYEPSWLTKQFTQHLGRTILIIIAAFIIIYIVIVILSALYRHYTSEEYMAAKEERARLHAAQEAQRKKQREKQEKLQQKEAERKAKEIERKQAAIEAARKKEEAKKQAELDRKKREEEKRQSKEYFAKATSAAERKLREENVLVPRRTLEGEQADYGWVWFLVLLVLLVGIIFVAWFFLATWKLYSVYVIIGAILAIIVILILMFAEWLRGKKQRIWRFKVVNTTRKVLKTGWPIVGSLSLRTEEVLAACALRLRQSSAPTAFAAHDDPTLNYFVIDGRDIEEKDIDTLVVNFAVPKKWLARNRVDPEKVRVAKFTDSWRNCPTEQVGQDAQFYYFSAEAGIGNFAIVGRPRKEKIEPVHWPWAWIISVLILLLVIGGAYVLSFYATPVIVPAIPAGVSGIPPQYWAANTEHTLNLSQSFVDPDKDNLVYTYTPVHDIAVTVKDGVATFLPAPDFVGERTITFTADDGKGGKVPTNEIRLVVYEAPTVTLLGAIGTFCKSNFVAIAIAAIVIVLIILGIEYRAPLKKFLDED